MLALCVLLVPRASASLRETARGDVATIDGSMLSYRGGLFVKKSRPVPLPADPNSPSAYAAARSDEPAEGLRLYRLPQFVGGGVGMLD
jgi:hypothetical protein